MSKHSSMRRGGRCFIRPDTSGCILKDVNESNLRMKKSRFMNTIVKKTDFFQCQASPEWNKHNKESCSRKKATWCEFQCLLKFSFQPWAKYVLNSLLSQVNRSLKDFSVPFVSIRDTYIRLSVSSSAKKVELPLFGVVFCTSRSYPKCRVHNGNLINGST